MSEIKRIEPGIAKIIAKTETTTVRPASRTVDKKTQVDPNYDRRRKQQDRRKRKMKPLIERRVSADRRARRIDTKA